MFGCWADEHIADMCWVEEAFPEFINNFVCVWVKNLDVCWHDTHKAFIGKKSVLFGYGCSDGPDGLNRKRQTWKTNNVHQGNRDVQTSSQKRGARFHGNPPIVQQLADSESITVCDGSIERQQISCQKQFKPKRLL